MSADEAVPEPEPLRVLDEEHARGLRGDPRIPSRAELDEAYEQGEARGWDEQSARAWEYLDSRREIADERAAAVQGDDTETVRRLDRRHDALDWNYLGVARQQRAPDIATADESPVVVVAQDPRWERPSVPDDLGALRARVAALHARRGSDQREHRPAGPGSSDGADKDHIRRAQLAQWADDDTRRGTRTASAGGHDTSDEDRGSER